MLNLLNLNFTTIHNYDRWIHYVSRDIYFNTAIFQHPNKRTFEAVKNWYLMGSLLSSSSVQLGLLTLFIVNNFLQSLIFLWLVSTKEETQTASSGKMTSLLLVSEVQTLAILYIVTENNPQGSLALRERQARPYRLLKFNFSSEGVTGCKNKKLWSVPSLPQPLLYSADDKHQKNLAAGFPKGDKCSTNTYPMQRDISWESLTLPFCKFNTLASSGITIKHKQQMAQVAQHL